MLSTHLREFHSVRGSPLLFPSASFSSGHCETSPRFVDSSNHLEGVGYCEEHADPVEGGGEVEEAGEPANAEDADQGHAALQLGHDLGLLVQVVVPVDSLNHHNIVITLHSWPRCPARPDGNIRPETILSTSFGSSGTTRHR